MRSKTVCGFAFLAMLGAACDSSPSAREASASTTGAGTTTSSVGAGGASASSSTSSGIATGGSSASSGGASTGGASAGGAGAGGTSPNTAEVVASQLDWPVSLALDSTHVYWAESSGAVVRRAPLAGGASIALATGPFTPWGVALDPQSVYIAELAGGSVLRVPKAGGPATTFVAMGSNYQLEHIVTDGTTAYWDYVNRSQIDAASLTTGAVVTLAAASPSALALDPKNVYWAAYDGVWSVPKTGGSTNQVVATMAPEVLAVDAASVYWLRSGALWSAPVGGGAPVLLAMVAKGSSWDGEWLTIDASFAYVAYGQSAPNAHDGKVVRVPLGGGAPVELAGALQSPMAIAVDAAHVYWTDVAAGAVMRVKL